MGIFLKEQLDRASDGLGVRGEDLGFYEPIELVGYFLGEADPEYADDSLHTSHSSCERGGWRMVHLWFGRLSSGT